MNFLDVMSEHWAINVEQVSNINIHIDQNTIYLYINGAEEPSIRIECENEKSAQSFFTLWQMRINDVKEKCNENNESEQGGEIIENHINMLVQAINQGTKKFSYKEAPFLHDAMTKHFEFITGIKLEDIIEEHR